MVGDFFPTIYTDDFMNGKRNGVLTAGMLPAYRPFRGLAREVIVSIRQSAKEIVKIN